MFTHVVIAAPDVICLEPRAACSEITSVVVADPRAVVRVGTRVVLVLAAVEVIVGSDAFRCARY